MKVIYSFLLIVLNLVAINAAFSKQELEFTPINITFKGIESAGDTIVVYGDFGSMFTSFDGGERWRQIKAFKKGGIAKIFLKKDKMIAFTDAGEIAESFDCGENWDIETDLKDSILAVIEYPGGYFLRSDDKLMTISKKYEKTNDFNLTTRDIPYWHNITYTHSLAYFKNRLIVEIDSSKLIRFDLNLNPLDTFSLRETSYRNGKFQIFTDSGYLYSKVRDTIFRMSDFDSVEIVYTKCPGSYLKYYIIDGATYFLEYGVNIFAYRLYRVVNKDSAVKVASCSIKKESGPNTPKDFALVNDEVIIAGKNKLLMTINLNNDSVRFINDFTGLSHYSYPDRLNDSTFLFCRGYYNGDYDTKIYKTTDMGVTFRPTVDLEQCPMYNYVKFDRKFYDSSNKKLYFCGGNRTNSKQEVLISNDFGRAFEIKESPINFGHCSYPYPNTHKNNNKIVTAYNTSWRGVHYPSVFIFNEEFDLADRYLDSNMFIYYIRMQSPDTFLIHCYDYLDSALETKYTENRAESWEIIKKYDENDSMLYYQEINYKGNPALGIFHFRRIDSVCSLYLLDLKKRSAKEVYSYKITEFHRESLIENGIACEGDTAYIAIKDTLFRTDDIFDRSKWEYLIFPYNGRIKRTFKIYGDEIFARYDDDYNLHNIFWLAVPDEFPYPKPHIAAGDIDFGEKNIADAAATYKTAKIYNHSPGADLIVSEISNLNEPAFATDLPEIDSNNTLTIEPNSYYEYEVSFKPEEPGMYIDSIVFYSNAKDSDNVSYFRGEGFALPVIQAEDCNFGEYDISHTYSLPKKLKIRNVSSDAELKIIGYSELTDSAFSTNLPEIDSLNPIVVEPEGNYEYTAYFSPSEAKVYSDSIIFHSNASGDDKATYITGEGIDTSTSVVDNSIEKRNYLYTFPPYPTPSKNIANALIYWDTSKDINNDKIEIIDTYGNIVGGGNDITIRKEKPYSGILTWHCGDVANGVYFILITHGTEKRAIKVMVNR